MRVFPGQGSCPVYLCLKGWCMEDSSHMVNDRSQEDLRNPMELSASSQPDGFR